MQRRPAPVEHRDHLAVEEAPRRLAVHEQHDRPVARALVEVVDAQPSRRRRRRSRRSAVRTGSRGDRRSGRRACATPSWSGSSGRHAYDAKAHERTAHHDRPATRRHARCRGQSAAGHAAARRVRGAGNAILRRAHAEPAVPAGAGDDPDRHLSVDARRHVQRHRPAVRRRGALDRDAARSRAGIAPRSSARPTSPPRSRSCRPGASSRSRVRRASIPNGTVPTSVSSTPSSCCSGTTCASPT